MIGIQTQRHQSKQPDPEICRAESVCAELACQDWVGVYTIRSAVDPPFAAARG